MTDHELRCAVITPRFTLWTIAEESEHNWKISILAGKQIIDSASVFSSVAGIKEFDFT